MLLDVQKFERVRFLSIVGAASVGLAGAAIALAMQTSSLPQTRAASPPPQPAAAGQAAQSGAPANTGFSPGLQTPPAAQIAQNALRIVVLDPAHGGTDLGARGAGGFHESDIVLDFAGETRRALEQQGFQVLQTRQGNDNPSFDDRSAMANAQRGAVFVTLHIASTGIQGTVRVYVNSDLPPVTNANGLIPWDRAQAPFLGLSRKFGDLVQGMLAQQFKGSPDTAETGSVRQLRTTAAPAIAVEISSVTVSDRADLERMAVGVGDAIARGATAFKPIYAAQGPPGALP